MFAPPGVTLTGMTKQQPKSILGSMRASGLRGRGAVYKWLNEHYRTVTRGFERTESTWEGVIDAMVAAGVTNREGGRPSANSVLRVWQRVCEDRAARALKAKREQPNRSRSAGGWEPPVATARTGSATKAAVIPRDKPQPGSSAAPAGAAADGAPEKLSDHAQATLAAIRRKLAHVDRHIVQSAEED